MVLNDLVPDHPSAAQKLMVDKGTMNLSNNNNAAFDNGKSLHSNVDPNGRSRFIRFPLMLNSEGAFLLVLVDFSFELLGITQST